MTYYDILQVSMEASDEVIKAAYKSLVKKYHPDSGIESDVNQFLKVEEAYETLSDSESRKKYDESLRAEKKEEKIQVKEPEGFFTSAEKIQKPRREKGCGDGRQVTYLKVCLDFCSGCLLYTHGLEMPKRSEWNY